MVDGTAVLVPKGENEMLQNVALLCALHVSSFPSETRTITILFWECFCASLLNERCLLCSQCFVPCCFYIALGQAQIKRCRERENAFYRWKEILGAICANFVQLV